MPTKEARQAMATWISAIADNVKNPIAGIGAALDHAQERLTEPEVVGESLGKIRERLTALNEYVTELADFARPAAIRTQTVSLEELLRQSVRASSLPRGTDVVVDVPADTSLVADPAKLTIVIKALLRNGFEAVAASKTPRLLVSAGTSADGDVRITVEDNGPGMPADSAQHAFEPFYTTKEAGTGLGLSIARKYTEAHGGSIAIDRSKTLNGCRVTIILPKSRQEARKP